MKEKLTILFAHSYSTSTNNNIIQSIGKEQKWYNSTMYQHNILVNICMVWEEFCSWAIYYEKTTIQS